MWHFHPDDREGLGIRWHLCSSLAEMGLYRATKSGPRRGKMFFRCCSFSIFGECHRVTFTWKLGCLDVKLEYSDKWKILCFKTKCYIFLTFWHLLHSCSKILWTLSPYTFHVPCRKFRVCTWVKWDALYAKTW